MQRALSFTALDDRELALIVPAQHPIGFTQFFEGAHSGDNIKRWLVGVMDDQGIRPKDIGLVTEMEGALP